MSSTDRYLRGVITGHLASGEQLDWSGDMAGKVADTAVAMLRDVWQLQLDWAANGQTVAATELSDAIRGVR